MHKTRQVSAFLAEHPTVHMHCTPTYSSWLNQVELWFAKIEREVIARGVLTVADGPQAQAHALHPPVQQAAQAGEVEVL